MGLINSFKTGLKLYSTDHKLIPEISIVKDYVDFIELYIIPGTYETVNLWKSTGHHFTIHAPHSFQGVNLAQIEKRISNRKHIRESLLFADDLGSELIIAHGGNNGTIDELIFQITSFKDDRIFLENKPKKGLGNEICIGWSPEEIQYISEAGALNGLVLDFTHASCAAFSLKTNPISFSEKLMTFGPKVFHVSDGDLASEKDIHRNIGKGNFDLARYLSLIPHGSMVTIETPRDNKDDLSEFVTDINNLKNILENKNE